MVTFVLSSSPEQIPVQIRRYAIISRPDIASIKDLKGKRLAINTFGSSADCAIYQLLSRNGLDPNKDVTLLSVAGSPDARFAALIGGSVGDQCRISGKTLEARPSGSMLSIARNLTPISRYLTPSSKKPAADHEE